MSIFINKLRSAFTYNQLIAQSDAYIDDALNAEDKSNYIDLVDVYNNRKDIYKEWKIYYSETLKECSEAKNLFEQNMEIRKAVIVQSEFHLSTGFVIGKELSEDDRKILLKKLFPDKSFEECMSQQSEGHIYARLTMLVLRMLLLDFKDSNEGDWFDIYYLFYTQFAKLTYECVIENEKGKEHLFLVFLPALKREREISKKRIFNGENWACGSEIKEILSKMQNAN